MAQSTAYCASRELMQQVQAALPVHSVSRVGTQLITVPNIVCFFFSSLILLYLIAFFYYRLAYLPVSGDPCTSGTYQPEPGATSCSPCPSTGSCPTGANAILSTYDFSRTPSFAQTTIASNTSIHRTLYFILTLFLFFLSFFCR